MSNTWIEVTGKCLWAHVAQPNMVFYPHHSWSIDIKVDNRNEKLIRENKLKIYDKYYEYGKFVRFRRRVKRLNGEEKESPFLLDDKGKFWNKGLIGNGSLVTVISELHKWKYKNEKGISADLYCVQVLDHIPYPKERSR